MLIDSHCHIPHEKYTKGIEEIMLEADTFGVEKFINIGTSIKDSRKALETANKYPNIFCSIGVYPHEDKNHSLSEIKTSLEESLKLSKKIVAIGECGIDISNWQDGRSIEEQVSIFELQINIAIENNLPIIVHNRNGDDYVYDILRKYKEKNLCGVIHCFDSDWEFAQKILDIGFYISFSNLITYPKKDALLEVVDKVPMDRFLVETDAPYLPPQSQRGGINYPKYVRIVAEKVAQVKQKTFDEVSLSSCENTCYLFNI